MTVLEGVEVLRRRKGEFPNISPAQPGGAPGLPLPVRRCRKILGRERNFFQDTVFPVKETWIFLPVLTGRFQNYEEAPAPPAGLPVRRINERKIPMRVICPRRFETGSKDNTFFEIHPEPAFVAGMSPINIYFRPHTRH
jgi:hypothetical protein